MYRIYVKGHLSPDWSEHFQGLTVRNLPNGTAELCGQLRDQAALHGVLAQIRDLGLELLSMQKIKENDS